MPSDFLVRPMAADDVPAVVRLTDDAYHDLAGRTHRTGWPEPSRRSPEEAADWTRRAAHLQASDPGGCWVVDDPAADGLLGAAIAMRRDTTWLLATYAVRPDRQGQGLGRPLLEAALSHGRNCLRGMLAASEDPAAVRRYRLTGFTMHPTMLARGSVPRSVLPVVERVREGSAGDIDLMNSVDRQVRSAAHGVDHELLTRLRRLVVTDSTRGSGYAYLGQQGAPYLLAATNRRTATALLWETLAATSPDSPVDVRHVTPANEWAVDVAMTCRMALWTDGYLALRGMKPPVPYLPSGQFL